MNKNYLIFLILFTIAAAIASFSYLELSNSKMSLEKVIQNESNNLTYSLKFAIENNLKSNSLIEEKVKDNIVSSSTLLAHTFKHQSINTDFLKKFSKDYNLDLIIIISTDKILSNIDSIKLSNFDDYLISEIEFIKSENYFWLDIGNQMFNNVEYVSIAGHFGTDNVIIISGIQSSSLLDMRRSVGIGKLINDFNRNNQLLYTCLQDTFGIIAASRNINELSTIKSDTFLQKSYSNTNPNSRYYLYQNTIVLENVIKIENDDDDFLLRIGLNLEYINQINQANSIRTIFLSLGLFIISVVIVILVNQRNKHRKLKDEHQKVIEYTNALMNNINDAVIGIDINMLISIINLKAIKLFKIDFTHLKSYSDIFNNDELILKDSILNNKGIDYLEIKYKEYVLAISISIINGDKPENIIALAVIRDITEIKKLEEIKSRTERMEAVNVLASSVAHEIRNPMNAVNLIAQRLEIEFEPKSDYDEYFNLIKTVRSEIKRVNNIITQFLEFGRI